MKTKFYMGAILLIMILLVSCASTSEWHMRHIKVYSIPGLNIKGHRLGVAPFKCKLSDIGQTVGDTVAANLLNSGFTVVTVTRVKDVDYILTGNIAIGSVRKGVSRWSGGRAKDYMAGATCQIIEIKTKQVVMNVTYGKAADLHDAVSLGELLAEGIKRELRGEK